VPRTVAVRLSLRTACGPYFANWRTGVTTVWPGEDNVEVWAHVIPNAWPFIGENQLVLEVTDITAAPYNQAPYQTTGGRAYDEFIFTGHEPGGGGE
jgi:hypothetical protein